MSRRFPSLPVQVVDKLNPIGMELFRKSFTFGPFLTHKIKTKVEYISISNILHLLSVPDPVCNISSILFSC